MKIKKAIYSFYKRIERNRLAKQRQTLLNKFYQGGQKPWSAGYHLHKEQEIIKSLSEKNLQQCAAGSMPFEKYGYRLDERIVEYPWIFSRLSNKKGIKILDAGSTFNFEYIVDHAKVKEKELYIHTFYPEKSCFWKKRISYVFGDLRSLPYRDSFFDEIVCHSTLEHIDMDNSLYGYSNTDDKRKIEKSYDYLLVINELLRTLKSGGKLLLTFPFGTFENHGFFQQFDSEMLSRLLTTLQPYSHTTELTFFRYINNGWIFTTQDQCEDATSYNPHTKQGDLGDNAAHSRGICCISFVKV